DRGREKSDRGKQSTGSGRLVKVAGLVILRQRPSFFFQAEDGIRDGHVTGVQTCALPISLRRTSQRRVPAISTGPFWKRCNSSTRSEERRVGKSVDLGGGRIVKKKKEADTDRGGK